MIYSEERFPEPEEICTIASVEMHKVASLLFDRVYVSPSNKDRPEFNIPKEFTFGFESANKRMMELILKEKSENQDWEDHIVDIAYKNIIRAYQEEGLNVVPSFGKYSLFEKEYLTGSELAFEAVLRNIKTVNKGRLEWDQIIEFRKDSESVRKYRDLRVWMRNGLRAASIAEAVDIIAGKIEDYDWALKKHGLETIKGALTVLLDYKKAGLSVSAIAGGTAVAGPIGGAIAGGLVIVGQTSAWLLDRYIEKKDIIRGDNSEIAIITDINKKFGSIR